MTIEFLCPNCQKLLRTTNDKAGVKAKCPGCGGPITVPFPDEDEFEPAGDEFGYDVEDAEDTEQYSVARSWRVRFASSS